tara:strand:+ start:1266 stop:2213 length:948 start_codon:yes stop_codon:yes gene_type:complete
MIDIQNIENLMIEQVNIGPRHPGSPGSLVFKNWLFNQIDLSWDIEIQNFTHLDTEVNNYFITHSTSNTWPKYIFGAHYDSRKVADKDELYPNLPVPGANDGASGVAVILEMLSHIPSIYKNQTGFILFDAEDQGSGGMEGWDWIIGSEYFVSQMTDEEISSTEFFLLFDMIANDELTLRYEANSDDALNEEIWNVAHSLGYQNIFEKRVGVSIIDDHRPFLDANIPSVNLIDLLGYPEHHTIHDTMENVSPENAAIVLDVVIEWMKSTFWSDGISTSSMSHNSNTTDTPIFITMIILTLFSSHKLYRKFLFNNLN